ncbi:peptidoglycan L-alanyl-D-glutamate endopeptidase [Solibacillus sp. R5-41]|uniref:M15 family metallopeptidase n=1 Tax=Solibacillus sp. R5-41 TaxID=2048654 RepID=UPI000C129602|nr:M15 family metallopeptidase [Solibacillus sp. R5-41]ATP40685.1 peptidoglycan L-alanyl-D-glutamate endopeptidase [Solibacillus sp. R5-41]
MSVTTTCRDLSELTKVAELACRLLFQECFKAGIKDVFITETFRSPERQKYLYSQGRTRPGQIVTWTLNSNHSGRLAWDIAVGPPKSLYDLTTLNKVGAIARKLGITWGGDWSKNIDRPHFEVKTNWSAPTGYKLEGQVIVPSNSKMKVQLIVKDESKEAEIVAKETYEKDAAPATWAKDAVEWTKENGVSDGTFLKRPATREEVIVMLHNVQKIK